MPSLNPDCDRCPLHLTAKTVCVAGAGPPQAQIMLVGEAPGRNEDALGVPFIGRAGELLNEVLRRTGFRREELYITNVVKCRPPDATGKDRAPSAKEVKACRAYLDAEIRQVQPQYIVALGGPALKALTGQTGVGVHRGSLLALRGAPDEDAPRVFATVHPAAGLYYPHFTEQLYEDLKLLRRTIANDFVDVNIPWQDHGEMAFWFVRNDPWAFDLETNGTETRDPFCHIYLCAIDDGHGPVKVLADIPFATNNLQRAVDGAVRLVGHNSSAFDRLMLRRVTGADIKCDDTMLLAWLLHEEWGAPTVRRLNLQALCVSELGVRPWKKDVTWDWSVPTSIPPEKAREYNARDARYTRKLFLHLRPQVEADGLWEFYDKLLLPASRALSNMEERGLYINRDHVAEARRHYEALTQQTLDNLRAIAAEHGIGNFNPGSTAQVADLVFERMGHPTLERTKGGKASTAVGVMKSLREMAPDNPFFDKVLQYRRYRNKMLGTYIAHFESEVDYYGRWYPWYSLVQTATGRTSGNAQQIPRPDNGPMIRRCVAAPPGKVLIEADFSQLEMRVAASRYVFDEPNLRAAFARGDDVHRLLAAEITGKRPEDVLKPERDNAKPPNFLFLYGGEEQMYVRTLLEDSDIVKSLEQARAERDAFFRRWPGLPAGHARVVAELLDAGQVRTLFGTLRRLPDVRSMDRAVKLEAFRQAVNAVVQGPACHIGLIGLVLLEAAGLAPRSFQHDAYLLWADDNEAAVGAATAQIRYLLERGVPEVMRTQFGLDWDVPLKVDIAAGTAWTQGDRNDWVR